MDLWQLHIFVSVVENQSFSRASKAINLSQPTVSSHIKELESHFNCRLLDRLGKTTEPTRAGQILYGYAKELLALKDKTESAIHDFLGKLQGPLRLGGSTIPSGYILPRILGRFSQNFPDVSLSLSTGSTGQITQKVSQGELELGIVGSPSMDPRLVQEQLIADQMRLILPAGHELSRSAAIDPDTLFTLPFIAREPGSGTWESLEKSLQKSGKDARQLKTVMTLGSTTAVIQAIVNKAGVSILSGIAVQSELEQGILKALPVRGLDLGRHFYLIYSARRTLSPMARAFIDYARKELGNT